MRVLVSTTAGAGHLGPLVPLARACRAAGHDVAVAAPASFAPEVRAAGLEHLPFDDVAPELLGEVFSRLPALSFEEANAVVLADVFGRLDARAALPGLTEILRERRPDVVLRDPAELGSLAAAVAAGVPHATVAIGVRAMLDLVAAGTAAPMSELDALVGLPDGTLASAVRAAPVLTCLPPGFDPDPAHGPDGPSGPAAGPVHRFRDDGLLPGPGALPAPWGDPAHPLVYVTFGSVAAGQAAFRGVHPAVVEAFADQPVRVLLTTGTAVDPADLGPAPAHVRVERWWPQRDVMAHARVVVGHGGFGTTTTALAAGVPQVVLPLFSSDQRLNAEAVAAAGAGLHVEGGPAAVAALPGAVARLLADPSCASAARAVAAEMAALPPVEEAVAQLERLAAG